MDWEVVWRWALPSVGLAVWLSLTLWLVPRVTRRMMAPSRTRRVAIASLATCVSLLGLWLFAVAVPSEGGFREFVVEGLEPWFWGTAALVGCIIVGTLVVRRFLDWLLTRARSTESTLDDAVIGSMRRPAHLLVLFAAFVLWVDLVPAPAAISTRVDVIGEIALIIVIALFVDSLVSHIINSRRDTSRVFATAGPVLRAMARILVFAVAALMALSSTGIPVTPIVASLGVGSLAVGLALQSTIEDFIAGLLIAADQPIHIGDVIELGERDLAGTVDAIGWRTTRILTPQQTKVIVPNSALARATIVNRSRPSPVVRFQAEVGVHYDSDLAVVARLVHEVASELQASHEFATRDFTPLVTFHAFSASSIDLKVWLEATDWMGHYVLLDGFIRALHARFRDANIVIPFPITTIDLPPEVRSLFAVPKAADPATVGKR